MKPLFVERREGAISCDPENIGFDQNKLDTQKTREREAVLQEQKTPSAGVMCVCVCVVAHGAQHGRPATPRTREPYRPRARGASLSCLTRRKTVSGVSSFWSSSVK